MNALTAVMPALTAAFGCCTGFDIARLGPGDARLAVHGGELFPQLRAHIEKVMRRPLKELLELINGRGESKNITIFSEFNSAGAFGMYYMPEHFQFIDTEKDKVPDNPIYQFWSQKRADHPESQAILKEHGLLQEITKGLWDTIAKTMKKRSSRPSLAE